MSPSSEFQLSGGLNPWRASKFCKTVQKVLLSDLYHWNRIESFRPFVICNRYFSCLVTVFVLLFPWSSLLRPIPRASTVAGLRSQSGLGLKWFFLCQKLHLVLFLWGLLSYLLSLPRAKLGEERFTRFVYQILSFFLQRVRHTVRYYWSNNNKLAMDQAVNSQKWSRKRLDLFMKKHNAGVGGLWVWEGGQDLHS